MEEQEGHEVDEAASGQKEGTDKYAPKQDLTETVELIYNFCVAKIWRGVAQFG